MKHAVAILQPVQLGVGIQGGVEAAVHALQDAVLDPEGSTSILSLDIENAFNCLSRSFMLRALFEHNEFRPVFSLVHWAYSSPSDLLVLKKGKVLYSLPSSMGVRQGDPLGSFLFSVAMLKPYSKIASVLTNAPSPVAVIDDLNLISSKPEELAQAYSMAKQEFKSAGLRLKPTKVKLVKGGEVPQALAALAEQEKWQVVGDATTLLGASVGPDRAAVSRLAVQAIERHQLLFDAITEPQSFSTQEALILLRTCASPRLVYQARVTSPSCFRDAAAKFDEMQVRALEKLLLLPQGSLPEGVKTQAFLPLKFGGLGLQSAAAISAEAWFSSQALAASHLDSRFPEAAPRRQADLAQAYSDVKAHNPAHRFWADLPSDASELVPRDASPSFFSTHSVQAEGLQHKLAQIRHLAIHDRVINEAKRAIAVAADDVARSVARANLARLVSVSAKKAHLWLLTYPSCSDLVLNNDAMHINLSLRLGLPMFDDRIVADTCACSPEDPIDLQADPYHWLGNCRLHHVAKARIHRHDCVKRAVSSWANRLGAIVSVEPRGLGNDDGKRPDASVQLGGDLYLLDVSVVNPLCRSHTQAGMKGACEVARQAAAGKIRKYADLAQQQRAKVLPLILEATGGFETRVSEFSRLVKQATRGNGMWVPSEVVHGLERSIAIAVMRGNAAMVTRGQAAARRYR